MMYLCFNCLSPIYQSCQQHKTSNIKILSCGHYYHSCCLIDQTICPICQTRQKTIAKFNTNYSQAKFQLDYYQLFRNNINLFFPLYCLICHSVAYQVCPIHTIESNTNRLLFLDCGHVVHACCYDQSCPVCNNPQSLIKKIGKINSTTTYISLKQHYQQIYDLNQEQFAGDSTDLNNQINYFNTKLTTPHAKYCRCILHVAAKQPNWCIQNQDWRQNQDGLTCYNPYAICTKSVKRRTFFDCFSNYNLDQIPKKELDKLILLKKNKLAEYKLPNSLQGVKKLQKILNTK